jgi:hypothetical protein
LSGQTSVLGPEKVKIPVLTGTEVGVLRVLVEVLDDLTKREKVK